MSQFVFHDPNGKRWTRLRRGAQTFAIFFGVLSFVFVLIAFISPQLPGLGLPGIPPLPAFSEVSQIISGQKAEKNVPFRLRKAARNLKLVRSTSPVIHPKIAARPHEGHPIVFGYYVNWDPAPIASL